MKNLNLKVGKKVIVKNLSDYYMHIITDITETTIETELDVKNLRSKKFYFDLKGKSTTSEIYITNWSEIDFRNYQESKMLSHDILDLKKAINAKIFHLHKSPETKTLLKNILAMLK